MTISPIGAAALLYTIIAAAGAILLALLATVKNSKAADRIFAVTAVFSVVVGLLAVTAAPSNYTTVRTLGFVALGLSSTAVLVRILLKKRLAAKIILAVATLMSLVLLFR